MTNKTTSDLYASLSESYVEANTSDFETISLKVPIRTAAMIQAVSVALSKPVNTLFTDRLSKTIADRLLFSKGNIPLVYEALKEGGEAGSALEILRKTEVVREKGEFAITEGLRTLAKQMKVAAPPDEEEVSPSDRRVDDR